MKTTKKDARIENIPTSFCYSMNKIKLLLLLSVRGLK
ncbi:hypothetical protein IGI58_001038 [Enterococcus sp. AZ020]